MTKQNRTLFRLNHIRIALDLIDAGGYYDASGKKKVITIELSGAEIMQPI